jgi:hypothetical protein
MAHRRIILKKEVPQMSEFKKLTPPAAALLGVVLFVIRAIRLR